ncbi:lipopolysaccharide biosynthesis protein [Brevibacillus reuszeri]|uniref:lipopolysaccharide biosynthesis protein n=1 Tax=Brevibacillus reuszeri TaxID=54915 RepID=UPI00367142DC
MLARLTSLGKHLPLLKHSLNGLLFRNTLWMLLGDGIRLLLQMVYFVIIARTLGASGYGLFIGVVTLVAILTPFSSLGRGELLVMNVSRDKEVFREYFGNALFMTVVSGIALTVVAIMLGRFFLPESISMSIILWVALSDLIMYRVVEICGQAYQALERLKRTAQLNMLMGAVRLVGALALLLVAAQHSVSEWAILYFLTTAVMALAALALVVYELGKPCLHLQKVFAEWRSGAYFSISQSSLVVYSDIGKTILVKFASPQHAGIYAAASRIVDVTLSPIYSLMSAAFSRFFQEGTSGIGASVRYANKLLVISLIYSAFAWLGLYLIAPVLPWVLGEDYRFAVEAVQWMAVIPLLKSLHFFAADALTGAGFQGWRSAIQVFVAILVAGLHILIVPLFLWKGAIVVSLIGDILLCCGYWGVIGYLQRKERIVRVTGQLTN